VTVVSSPGSDQEIRIGLVVSRSVGGAVQRNRVKRRLRSACQEVEWEHGMDYVIMADSQVGEVPFPVLADWLQRAVEGRKG
jgi:ribonuclease P protein component